METRVRESPTGVLGWIAGSYYLYDEATGTQARLYHLDLIEGEVVLASTDPEYDLRIKQDSLNHWIENQSISLTIEDTEIVCENQILELDGSKWIPVIHFGDHVSEYKTMYGLYEVSFKIQNRECFVSCSKLNVLLFPAGKVTSLEIAARLVRHTLINLSRD